MGKRFKRFIPKEKRDPWFDADDLLPKLLFMMVLGFFFYLAYVLGAF